MAKREVKTNNQSSNYWIFGTVLFFAAAGLLSAFMLSVEKIHLLQDPNAQLSCSVNVWINCASVMKTWQASVFGFPNSYIGLMAYPVIITLAVAMLMGGKTNFKLPKLFMALASGGALLGVIFAYWLFFQSVYVIQVLCPWCLVVTFSTTMIFEALLRYNLRENNFNLPARMHEKVAGYLQKDYDKLLVAGWVALMVLLVYLRFKDFFIG